MFFIHVILQKEKVYQLVQIYRKKWMPIIISQLVVVDVENGNSGLD